MSTQPILAYDCACVGGSVALMVRGNTTHRTIGQTAQAAELIPAIDALLREAGIDYRNLSAIVTTVGPGSFTGVRIGLAALHGLALANGTPIKTLTTLEALAWAVAAGVNAPALFFVALRAGKGEIYAQAFTTQHDIPSAAGDIALYPEDHHAWEAPCFGNHLAVDAPFYLPGPDATILCAIAAHIPTTTLDQALPIYIRPPDAIAPAPHAWLSAN